MHRSSVVRLRWVLAFVFAFAGWRPSWAQESVQRFENFGADRFGLFNLQVGGHFVEVALDDLTYTSKAKR